MDITISPSKSQTLALVSCTPFCHSHSSSNLASIRREFLGCGYKLRPQGLRTRRKFKNLRFHIHSPRFLFRASLNSQIAAVFVVAMATLSAISIAYFNYSKRKKDGKEVSGASNLIFSQLVRDIMGFISKDQKVSIFGDVGKETTPKECKVLASEEIDDSHVCNHSDASWHSQESALIYEEDIISKVPEPPSADVLASIAIDYRSSEESEIVGLSSVPPGLSNSGVQQPHIFATKMSKLQTEVVVKEAEYGSELPMLMVNFKSSAAPVPVNESRTGLNEYRKPNYELGEGGKSTDDSGFFEDPVRKELHMFYEENQYVKTSLVNMNGVKTSSFNASLLESNTLSSVIGDNILRGADVSTQDSLRTAEYAEENVPYPYYKEGSFRRRRNLGKSRGIQSDTGRRILPQKVHDIPYPNGVHVNKKRDSSDEFSDYYRLLRQGRLTDCIEWLEYMERLGLLDTNKVYHAKFFETCKNQRAVKEAFRFINMIRNPSLSTFNMLMSVCASSQDSEGAFQVLRLAHEAGLKADCKLYTTLISTCAKCGKVDAMFEVFHEMVNAKVEPNVHTYGALIDGCAKAGQVAKAFGAYGIMRSKKVKPDRVIFNALITACGQSGAVDRAFDVLAEMGAETQPIDPDHVTVGALIKACINAGQVDRARKVYKMIDQYNIKGTPEVYTIALNSCSQTGDWEFACSVFSDMTRIGVLPDEMFLSALIDVAGHAGKLDEAFEVLREARTRGLCVGIVSYSSLMGACSNAKNWEKALELYEDIKSMKLKPTVSTMNALITALCDGDQLEKAMEVLSDMTREGLCPSTITYSILLVASEKKGDIEAALKLRSDAKKDGLAPILLMSGCLIGMCLRRFEKACILGEPVLSFNSGRPQIDNEWTSLALMVYRETIAAGVTPSMELFSQVLGCLQLPHEASLRSRLIENLDVITDTSKSSNLFSLIDGFGEYDPRAFSILEEAASLGIVPCVSFKQSPILVDARNLQIHTAEVYLLTVLKGLKHRLAAGARLPNISILVPVEKTKIVSPKGEKTIILAGKTSQAVAACLRRLRLPYQGGESYGKIRINGIVVKRWFQPKLASPFSGKPVQLSSSQSRLGKAITYQQRDIRTENLSME